MNAADNCRAVEPELTAYAQGELPAARSAEVEGHLSACDGCRASLGEIRSVFTMAGAVEDLVPSRRFKTSLASAIARMAAEVPARESLWFRVRSGAAYLADRMRTSPRFRLAAVSVAAHAVLLLVLSLVVLPKVADPGPAVVRVLPGMTEGIEQGKVHPEATEGPVVPGEPIPESLPSPRDRLVFRDPVPPRAGESLPILPPDRRVLYRPVDGILATLVLDDRIRERRLASLGLDGRDTAAAVSRALERLAETQQEDGSWPTAGRNPQYSAGVTATALLAFLADGHSHTRGQKEWRVVVARAVDRLLADRRTEGPLAGLLCAPEGHYTYNHAMATLALVETYAMDRRRLPPARARAIRIAIGDAVAFSTRARNAGGGWRYELPGPGPLVNNTSVSILVVTSLSAARSAGFEVSQEVFDGFTAWLKQVTGEDGVVGYRRRGDRDRDARTLTAGALFLEELLGIAAPLRERQALEVRRDLEPAHGSAERDGLLRFYAAHAFRLRGENALGMLVPSLLASQRPDGSWDSSTDRHAIHAGDAFLTGLNVLTLCSAYRWPS